MINIDVHEPEEAERFLGTSCEVSRWSLNDAGVADYMWKDHEGRMVHVERKTWGELLGSIPKVEDQLRRHMTNQKDARLLFILEGLAVPVQSGTRLLKPTNRDTLYVMGMSSTFRMSQVYAWLYQVQKYAEVFFSPNYYGTCTAMSSFYKGDQKPEHETFKRHFKKVTFHPNPQVVQLMGVMPGVGEKRAEALIRQFSTVWNVVSAKPGELARVDGIGVKLASQLLQRVGRPDV